MRKRGSDEDQIKIRPGSSKAPGEIALQDMEDIARVQGEMGYKRLWFPEAPSPPSSSPFRFVFPRWRIRRESAANSRSSSSSSQIGVAAVAVAAAVAVIVVWSSSSSSSSSPGRRRSDDDNADDDVGVVLRFGCLRPT